MSLRTIPRHTLTKEDLEATKAQPITAKRLLRKYSEERNKAMGECLRSLGRSWISPNNMASASWWRIRRALGGG
ncbi:MAG TPA: hypothetical protein EYP68_03080 [Candidatus Korarchaeota archaeon]|nr:hypothetical protein [Candidatus Korarchaeota archaeon]